MHDFFKYSLLTGSLLLAATATSEESFRQHGAHVHGQVEFNIAQDADELLVEINAPGADVVGFEHAPENQQQKEKLSHAVHTLQHADTILQLSSAAQCELILADVDHSLGKHAEDEHHDHASHNHSEHQHEDHGHEEHNHSGQHGEFTIEYHFKCGDIAKLKQIDTSWFKHFPATSKIKVNLLTDTAQIAAELTLEKYNIKL